MSHPSKFAYLNRVRRTLFLIWIVLVVGVASCNNACFVGVINPPNNSLTVAAGNPPPVCSQLQPMAAVKAAAHLTPACTGCSPSRQVTQVHLLLSGIELHPDDVADENSPEWQELAPDWARQPQWVDLQGDSTPNEVALPLSIAAQIPAGTYHQLRFRIAQSAEQFYAESHCSSVVASCVVTAEGNYHPLQTLNGHSYLRLEVASSIDLRTDQLNRLRIEILPEWTLHIVSTGVLDLRPLLGGHVVNQTAAISDTPNVRMTYSGTSTE